MKQVWGPARDQRIQVVKRFLTKPWQEKILCIRLLCLRLFGVLPVRLPLGGWWLAYNDSNGAKLVNGHFENAECRFVGELLKPGMTVLDIGAHHGLYTLLAARRVGANGQVVAFEPSPREQRKLALNLSLNRRNNVQVENCALGSTNGEADLFLVNGMETGCNSLRPPNVKEPTKAVRVQVRALDFCLQSRQIDRVDFIKMDVEGGEWDVLKGAVELLDRRPRPVILCEVQDIRTQPWGYRAKDVIDFLRCRRFHWFRFSVEGGLEAVDGQQTDFDGNFIAVPEERLNEMYGKSQEDLNIRILIQG